MKHPEVKSLFRYRSWKTRCELDRELELIRDGEIWCTTPAHGKLNDPFDCKIAIRTNLSHEELRKLSHLFLLRFDSNRAERRKIVSNLPKEFMSTEFDQYRSNGQAQVDEWPICSFASSALNILLWSYYSDCHKGMCIEYERNPTNGLGHDDATKKVEYRLQPEMTLTPLELIEYDDLSDDEKLEAAVFHQTLFWKLNNWCHEQEFRYIAGQAEGRNESPGEIKSVTFGMLMDKGDRRYVKQHLGTVVDYFEIGQEEDSFILERHQIAGL